MTELIKEEKKLLETAVAKIKNKKDKGYIICSTISFESCR